MGRQAWYVSTVSGQKAHHPNPSREHRISASPSEERKGEEQGGRVETTKIGAAD